MSLIDEIFQGRPGEQELRAAFRSSQLRQPITEESCEHITEGSVVRIVREPTKLVQGRLSADGEYACFETVI